MSPLETVKAALQAYVDSDRDAIEALIADDYSFTSPLDNALDREAYFATCWPNSKAMKACAVVRGGENGDHAWIVYEGVTADKRFRNAEVHRVIGGRLAATEVYFGWNVPHPVPEGEHGGEDGGTGHA